MIFLGLSLPPLDLAGLRQVFRGHVSPDTPTRRFAGGRTFPIRRLLTGPAPLAGGGACRSRGGRGIKLARLSIIRRRVTGPDGPLPAAGRGIAVALANSVGLAPLMRPARVTLARFGHPALLTRPPFGRPGLATFAPLTRQALITRGSLARRALRSLLARAFSRSARGTRPPRRRSLPFVRRRLATVARRRVRMRVLGRVVPSLTPVAPLLPRCLAHVARRPADHGAQPSRPARPFAAAY